MSGRVLVADRMHERGLRTLREAGLKVDEAFDITSEELIRVIPEYDAAIVRSRTKLTGAIIEAGRKLKVIGRAGVGLDNIDVKTAESKGILVVNTPHAPSSAVSELVFGLLLCLFRRLDAAVSSMKQGKWAKKELMGKELRGKTLGVVGFGRIGREVSVKGRAFGMKVIAYDVMDIREAASELSVEVAPDLDYLLEKSDVITIHVPSTPETHHLIDEEQLAKVKRGAYLVNTARGDVVNSQALLAALKDGVIAGACIDVYDEEPPADWELVKHEKVVATPHIGASTDEAQENAAVMIAEKVIEALKKS